MCAAGGLPGELHKFWRAQEGGGYHVEYGFSCMGYEIAGGLGVKLADPNRDVVVMVGDGSYLMMNSEIATSVAMGLKLTIVLLDNRGFGCINRLQTLARRRCVQQPAGRTRAATSTSRRMRASLGAVAESQRHPGARRGASRNRAHRRTVVLVIDTDPQAEHCAGGAWWDVAVARSLRAIRM